MDKTLSQLGEIAVKFAQHRCAMELEKSVPAQGAEKSILDHVEKSRLGIDKRFNEWTEILKGLSISGDGLEIKFFLNGHDVSDYTVAQYLALPKT